MLVAPLLTLALACTPPDDDGGRRRRHRTTSPTSVWTTTPTTPTGETADTGTLPTTTTPTTPVDCSIPPPPGPVTWSSTSAIRTEEDFDFDQLGYLLTQSNTDLKAIDRYGASHILAPNVGTDPAGIRSLITGDVLVAQPDTGAVRLVNYATGGSTTVLGGLNFPNGLEAGVDGMAYVSEYNQDGRVRMIDPYTGVGPILLEVSYPNGLALSPDEQTLYIATSSSLFWGDGRILALDREPDGTWGDTPRLVHEAGDLLDGLTTDVCGNLYVAEYSSGRVYRILLDGTIEPLADLSGGWSFSALRFGHGIGGFERDELYVTNRSELFVLDVGIEGRHILAAP